MDAVFAYFNIIACLHDLLYQNYWDGWRCLSQKMCIFVAAKSFDYNQQ